MDLPGSTDKVAINSDASVIAVVGAAANTSSEQIVFITLATGATVKANAVDPLFVSTLGNLYGGGLLTASTSGLRMWDRDRGLVNAEYIGMLIGGKPATSANSSTIAIPIGSYAGRGISVYTAGSQQPLVIPTWIEGRTAVSGDGTYLAWSESHSMTTSVRLADSKKGVPIDAGCQGHQGAASLGFASDEDTLYSWCVNAKSFAQTGTDTDQLCIYRPDSNLPAACKTMARSGIPLGFGDTSKTFYYAQPTRHGTQTAELRVVDTATMNETLVSVLGTKPHKLVHRSGDPSQIALIFDDRVDLYRIAAGVLTKEASIPGDQRDVEDARWNEAGVIFIAKDNSTVELISAGRRAILGDLVQLESAGDWVFATPDGRFEGTATAMRYVGWRDETGRFFPLDYLFNRYYTPLVFASAMHDRAMPAPEHDLFSELQIPGLRTMVDSEVAKIVRQGNNYVLCVNQTPDSLLYYSDGNKGIFNPGDFTDGTSDDCLHQYIIPEGQQIEVATRQGFIREAAPKTPWDNEKRDTPPGSRLKVLLIGAGAFTQDRLLDPLPAASASVDTLQTMFREQAAKATIGFAGIDMQVLEGPQATGAAIRNAFATLTTQTQPGDTVFIYMAGHGVIPAGQEMYFYLPSDAISLSMTHLRQTALSSADFSDFFMRLPAKRVLFFLDSCHSGGALDSVAKVGTALSSVEIANQNAASANHLAYTGGLGIYLYASSSPLNTIHMPESGPTLLAQLLKEKFEDQAAGRLWASDLAQFISARMQAFPSFGVPSAFE